MSKRTSIVCQFLENISRDGLERYQEIIRDYVRGRHGVYALYRKGKLYYVGPWFKRTTDTPRHGIPLELQWISASERRGRVEFADSERANFCLEANPFTPPRGDGRS